MHVLVGAYFFYLQIYLMVWMSVLGVAIYGMVFLINCAGHTRLANLALGRIVFRFFTKTTHWDNC